MCLCSHLASGRFQFVDGVLANVLFATNTSNLSFKNRTFDGLDIKQKAEQFCDCVLLVVNQLLISKEKSGCTL